MSSYQVVPDARDAEHHASRGARAVVFPHVAIRAIAVRRNDLEQQIGSVPGKQGKVAARSVRYVESPCAIGRPQPIGVDENRPEPGRGLQSRQGLPVEQGAVVIAWLS